jgi:ribonuclease VapC
VILDTSALVAILKGEPEAQAFAIAMERADIRRLSAANFVELASVVDSRRSARASQRMDELLESSVVLIEPVTEAHARIAREAYRDFGKGSGHPAQLNFGDCLAYALAKSLNEPLLFKGNDFGHTDVTSAT